MEQPGYQEPAELDFGNFSKQPNLAEDSLIEHANSNDEVHRFISTGIESMNGRHRPKPPRYNDDDDDEDEDEEDEEEDDLGPETNVDAVDEAPEEFGKLDQAMGQNYPDDFLSHGKREDDDFPVEIKQRRHQNELIAEADNVADSEDSEDEWNYYRPEENKQQQQQQANSNSLGQSQKDPALVEKPDQCNEEKELCSPKPCEEDSEDESQSAAELQLSHDNQQQQLEEVATATTDDADAEDVITAEYDEIHEQLVGKDQQQQLKELDTEAEAATIPEEDFPYDKEPEQHQFNDQFEKQPEEQQFNEQFKQPEESRFDEQFKQPEESQFDDQFKHPEEPHFEDQFKQPEEPRINEQIEQLVDQQQLNEQFEQQVEQQPINEQFEQSSEKPQINEQFEQPLEPQQLEEKSEQQLLNEPLDEQSEQHVKEELKEELLQPEQKLEQQLTDKIDLEQEVETEEESDMESHLNPDAAEFVPTSTNTSPLIPQIINEMNNDLVAGSPLKQSQRALKNRKIPSEQEFKDEISLRPSEIDDSAVSDYSNGDNQSPVKDATSGDLLGGFADENQCTMINPLNLDESEISSTRAEFGDESTANYSVASEFYKTGLSTIDCSYTGSERSDFDFSSKDPMATSMTPGDFKTAFEQEPDLNKVHELTEEDLMGDIQNGTIEETTEKIVEDAMDDDLVKEKIELDFENFIPQQEQNAEVFSAIVEQKESADNNDMFMNLRNSEQDHEFEQKKEEHDLLEPTKQSEVTSTENEKAAEFTMDDSPVYASNNPFSDDYVPASDQATNVQNLVDDMQNVTIEENKQQNFVESLELTPEEPEMQKSVHDEVMQNPLDLNFGGAYSEQKNDEPVLVSPVKEPQVMSSKFEEEDLMSRSVEALQLEQNQKPEQEDDFFTKSNHVEDLSPVVAQPEENLVEPSPVQDEVHEAVTENLDRKSINLSESLQEFTGLEEQLSPKYEVKDNVVEAPQILKENLVDEQKDVEEVKAPSPVPEPKLEKAPEVTNELPLSNETAENIAAPITTVATAAAAAAFTTAVAAGAAATAATKSAKPTTAAPKASKPTASSKIGLKSTTPTSPTKTGTAAKTGTTTAPKKSATTSTPRTKAATGSASKPATSTLTKPTASTKSTIAPKTAASTATKPAARTGATATATSRAKPLSSVTSKISSTSTTEKKPTSNGEIKPLPIGRSAPPPKAKPPTSTASTASKTGLVNKTTTTTRASTGTTTSAPKPRSVSATTTTKTTSSRLSSANVTSSTNSTSSRPKTTTASTQNTATKSKIGASAGAKSPMIDKQIKETANKQISSARSSTTTTAATTKSRLSSVTSSSTTSSATKRVSLVQKQSTAPVTASPTKKPPPISKPGSKTGTAASKVNSKVTSTTKSSSTTTTTANVVQNGVCEVEKTVEITTNNTTTADTTNIEEDIPKKDISPIEPVTDNQLITAE